MMVRSIHEPKEELASTTPKDELKKVKMTRRQRRRDKEGVGMPKGYGSQLAKYQLEKHTLSGLPSTEHSFTVLGIESSCDDTAAAVVRSDGTVLSNVVYSQHEIHEKFGGIVPNLAKGAHEENIEKAVQGAIESAGMTSIEDVDAIAVTKGPGLEVCLRVGFRKAQALARSSGKPFITVHHLEAHCMVARLAGERILREGANESAVVHEDCEKLDQEMKENSGSSSSPDTADLASGEDERHHFHMQPKVEFPFLTLLASGGHTSILLCKGMGEYSVLGGTLDDALGEAFDKASRLLGLRSASSGGLAVELEARKYVESQREGVDDSAFDESSVYPIKGYSYLKVPLRGKPTCDFSYSGLKNSFRMQVEQSRRTMLGSDGAGDDERTDAIAQATNAPAGQMEEAPKELVVGCVTQPLVDGHVFVYNEEGSLLSSIYV
jgi:N6-L-threonylcarbamoyladenine synthase